jgi:hypothetical protein
VRVQVRLRDLLERQALLSLPSSQNDNGLIRPHTLHSNLCKYISNDARDRVEHTFASLSKRTSAPFFIFDDADNTQPGQFDESYYARQMADKVKRLEPGEENVSES